MDTIDKYLLKEKGKTPVVAGILKNKICSEPDIKEEFELWLGQRKFPENNPIQVEGYTAADIAKLAPFLDGIGVYSFLITLRTKKELAMKIIEDGFPIL